jgi:hypothetical protein
MVKVPPVPTIRERQFLAWVVELAQANGWMVHHALPAMSRRGRWATWQLGASGFPDLVLVHPAGQLIVAELKVGRNQPTRQQEKWLDAFRAAGVEAHLWTWAKDRKAIQLRLTVI